MNNYGESRFALEFWQYPSLKHCLSVKRAVSQRSPEVDLWQVQDRVLAGFGTESQQQIIKKRSPQRAQCFIDKAIRRFHRRGAVRKAGMQLFDCRRDLISVQSAISYDKSLVHFWCSPKVNRKTSRGDPGPPYAGSASDSDRVRPRSIWL